MKTFIILFAALAFFSCQSNKEEAVADVCSTAGVTYSNGVSAIISNNGCLGCHSGAAPTAGFNLQTYDQVKGKATQTRAGTPVLFGAVSHMTGFSPMPKNAAKISSCDISKLKAWIDAGMPQ